MSNRLAIVGTGAMGYNHVRTAAALPEQFELAHIIDADVDRATKVAQEFGDDRTSAAAAIDHLDGDNTDAAIIASPSMFHAEQAVQLMEQGVHVLVEKPVALSLDDAERLKETAQKTGRILMAGHIELFNPAVHALKSLLKDEKDQDIMSMRFKRLGKVNDVRRLYHNVVEDLMLHDLYIAYDLSGANGHDNAKVVAAHGRRDTPASPDPAEALVRFGEIDGHFRASRAYAGGKVRTVEVETTDKVYTADLISRMVSVAASNEGRIAPNGVYIEDMQRTNFFPTQNQQPLTSEQIHFARSIAGTTTPEAAGVSIDHALRVLRLTNTILSNVVL